MGDDPSRPGVTTFVAGEDIEPGQPVTISGGKAYATHPLEATRPGDWRPSRGFFPRIVQGGKGAE